MAIVHKADDDDDCGESCRRLEEECARAGFTLRSHDYLYEPEDDFPWHSITKRYYWVLHKQLARIDHLGADIHNRYRLLVEIYDTRFAADIARMMSNYVREWEDECRGDAEIYDQSNLCDVPVRNAEQQPATDTGVRRSTKGQSKRNIVIRVIVRQESPPSNYGLSDLI